MLASLAEHMTKWILENEAVLRQLEFEENKHLSKEWVKEWYKLDNIT